MPAGRVLATQQARDAAKQLLALTGTVKEKVGRVLQQGSILADPTHWGGGLAGKWRNDWGPDTNQLNQAAAKLDELEHRAHQVVEDIFKSDGASGSAPANVIPATDINLRLLGFSGDSQQVHDRWLGLTAEEREALINTDPSLIGNLDGIPCADRDKANRIVLQQQLDALNAQLKDLDAHEPPYEIGGPRFPVVNPAWADWHDKKSALEDKLKGLNVINDRLKNNQPPALLLGLDTQGNGRGIVAINNPDTANNVITYVPGTGADLGGIGGDIGRSDRMVQSANFASHGTQTTSSITWVGYDAPPDIPHAVSPNYASNAEHSLHNFEVGLRTTHEGEPSRNTIIGHSYGSTTVGFTMRDEGLPVDDVIFVGSPGVGVEHASDLHVDPSHVYVGLAANDPIKGGRLAEPAALGSIPIGGPIIGLGDIVVDDITGDRPQVFGRDPSVPQFGASYLPTDPGNPLWEGGAHSQYWDPNSPSLKAIGQVAVGQQPHD
jgi:hypothetical protein